MPSPPLVTLIVPTVHHRAALFARLLRYFTSAGYRGPIVVSDHSPREHAGVIAALAAEHRGLDLKLLQHAPDLHFLTRLSLCAAAAQTPYVHLHADDDFIVFPALDRLVERMQREPGCSAAMGTNLNTMLETRQVQVLPKQAIPHAGAFQRLLSQLESYSSVLYALRRREEMIATFEFTVARCPDVQFWQYLESCVAALRGPVVVIEDLHYVRASHAQKWSALLIQERSREHFPYLILSAALQPRLAAFRAALLEACPDADAAKLDAALIHLLHRGLGAMGLPERGAPAAPPAVDPGGKALLARLPNPLDPAAVALQRIFDLDRR